MKIQYLITTRKILAALVITGFFVMFCLQGGYIPGLNNLGVIQIGAAILAGTLLILLPQATATLLFGRLYCSLLCPLGIMQDGIAFFRKKGKYNLPKHLPWLRWFLAVLFILSCLAGSFSVFNMLAPYSNFGRIATGIFSPIIDILKKFLNTVAAYLDWPLLILPKDAFYGMPVLIAAILTLTLLIFLVIKYGRIWCNYCPVGTLLGSLSQNSLFKIRLDSAKCVSCGICQKKCRAGRIDIGQNKIASSRCIGCLECVAACPKNALSYALPSKK